MYQFESRVRYSEVDSERHLTLPAVMDYLQDCCTFQSEDMDIGVEYLAEQKQAWVLSSWEIKVRRYPVMGEKICVETWPYAFKGFYGYRNFRITNGQGEELVLANSVWVYMDMERMRPMRIPEKVADAYRPEIGEELPGEWGARKLSVPEDGTAMPPVPVAGFFIDTNHHMNNGRYFDWIVDTLPRDFLNQHVPVRIDLRFDKEVQYGDEAQSWLKFTRTSQEECLSQHLIKVGEDDMALCEIAWRKSL